MKHQVLVCIAVLFIVLASCKAFNLLTFHGYKNEIITDTIHIEFHKDSTSIDTVRSVKKYYEHETNPKTVQTKWYITILLIVALVFVVILRNN